MFDGFPLNENQYVTSTLLSIYIWVVSGQNILEKILLQSLVTLAIILSRALGLNVFWLFWSLY